jgi:hypothetical protein
MARPKSPLKAWLMLSLAVLLLHLALLQTLPLSLHNTLQDAPSVTFATRTLAPEPMTRDTPVRSPATPPKPKFAAKTNVKPRPTAPVDMATVTNEAGDFPMSPQAPDTGPESPAPDALADAPPEPTAESTPEPTPTPEVSAPPPPREKAPSFRMEGLPGSVKLVYKVEASKFPYSLNGELLWAQKGDHYLASLSFGAFGQTRTQTSRGLVDAQGLAPERFSDKFRSEVAAHFNRDQAKVTFSANTPDAPLLSGAQDRLSVLIQLAALVASAPERFEAGTTLTIQTIGPRDADLWLFTVGALEALTLPGGTMPGLKLTRNPRQLYDQQVDIWLAPQLGYLPARIRITEANGDYIDQKWTSSEPASLP